MPGMSGFEAAEQIGEINRGPYLIFVTSKEELVFDSFDYYPFYFMRKRDIEGMRMDMHKIFSKLGEFRREEKEFILELPYNRKRSVRCRDILYLLSEGNYMAVSYTHLRRSAAEDNTERPEGGFPLPVCAG